MSGVRVIPYAAVAALGVLATLWGESGATPPPDAAEVFEVKVLEAQVPQSRGEGFDALYRMEVLSVLRSAARVQSGETVTVRTDGQNQGTLERGWIGTAYLKRDPKASGSDAAREFVPTEGGDSLVKLPPGAPSLKFTVPAPAGGQ